MPFGFVKKIVSTAVSTVKNVVKSAVNVVQKAVSWLQPSFPTFPDSSFGDSPMDSYEKGLLINKQSNDANIPVVYGERLLGGTRVFVSTGGSSNKYLYFALVLSEGEINSVEQIYVNDRLISWDGALTHGTVRSTSSGIKNYYVFGTYGSFSLLKAQCFMGKDDQVASSLLSEASGWNSSHRLRGISYIAFRCQYRNGYWEEGIPRIKVKIKGKKVKTYNSSLVEQTASYQTNPSWCILDYLTNERYGKGLATTDIDLQSFYDASVVCETQVTPYSGGSDINIFDTNYALDTGRKIIENLREMIKGCRGYLPFTQGKYKLIIETTGTGSITLTEDNILDGYVLSSPDKNSRYNRVIVSFINKNKDFQADQIEWPPRDDSGLPSAEQFANMKTEDGNVLLEFKTDFPSITSVYQAQEMAEIILRRSREALALQVTTDLTAYDLAIGDIVNITHASLGFSAKPFRVLAMTFNEDYTVSLNLVEHQNTHYTWASKDEEEAEPTTNLPDPFESTIDLTEVSGLMTLSDTIVEYNDGVIITKLLIDLLPLNQSFTIDPETGLPTDPPDSFYDYFEVEISEDGISFSLVGRGDQTRFEVLNVKDDVTYTVRVRYVNTVGELSEYLTQTHLVVGQSASPSNVQNFSINVVGDQAVLSWDAVTDLDLAYYVIKHSSSTTGATWINSKNIINKIARPATTATVPFQTGTYLIKAEDKRGNQSIKETLIVSNISSVNYVFETTINEHTAFSGTKSNIEVVVKDSVNHIGLTATGTLGDPNSSVPSSGTYDFANTITLPAKFKTKFDSTVVQTIENVAEYIDTGRPDSSTLIDDGTPDPFDGRTAQNSNTTLQISTSDDNVTFSAYQNFTTGEFEGRYFKFRALLTSADQDSRTLVNTLSVTASLPERTESGADISSGTGGKTITFNNAFRLNPAITISGQNMATGDYFTITSKSTSAFTIEFFDSSNISVNRTFDYQAKGVGQVIP